MPPDGNIPVAIDLTADEVELLRHGLAQWGGPVAPTDAVAVAVGFAGAAAMDVGIGRLASLLDAAVPALSPSDWRLAQAAVEVAFGSDVLGCGYEWSTVTGLSDVHSVRVLREVQRKLSHAWSGPGPA